MFGLTAEQKAEHEEETKNRKKIGKKGRYTCVLFFGCVYIRLSSPALVSYRGRDDGM